MTTQTVVPIAVSLEEARQWGCPHCGYLSPHLEMNLGEFNFLMCAEGNNHSYIIMGAGRTTGTFQGETVVVQPHPRIGIPPHIRPDKRPIEGDYFFPGEIIIDLVPGCSFCGGKKDFYHVLLAEVVSEPAATRVAGMFPYLASKVESAPRSEVIKVKIAACDLHQPLLTTLKKLTSPRRVITAELVKQACAE